MVILPDIRYALRALWKRPGFTAAAVLMLALGVGANTAIFSVLHAVLLQPLPFEEPDRLVRIWESREKRGWDRFNMNPSNFWDFRDRNESFEDLAAYFRGSFNLTGVGFAERVDGGLVSAGFFGLLGVKPILGRTFLKGENEHAGEGRVVLLSHDFWQQQFGGDAEILETSLTLDGNSFTVVGVLPPGEPWLDFADVFVPMSRPAQDDRVGFDLAVIGRLKPGVSMDYARADLELVASRLEEEHPEDNAGIGVDLGPSSAWIAGEDLRRTLWVLFGAVGLLLLIACVNLTTMLLVKATGRARETAVRAALGASRGRIARLVLIESLMLGALGLGVGLLLSVWLVELVRMYDPGQIPRLAEASLNGWVLGFTALVGLSAGILSGLVPALQMPRADLFTALREGDRGVAGSHRQRRLRELLVAAELALSLVLLVGAGLMIRSFSQLIHVERGFQTSNRIFLSVNFPNSYEDTRQSELRGQFLERVRALPMVQAASAISMRPLTAGNTNMGIVRAGQPDDPDLETPSANWRLVDGDYFRTMGIPLLRGRTFDDSQVVREPWQVILSQRLAARLFPEEEAVARKVTLWKGQDDIEAEVVGVVGDMRDRGLEDDPTLAVYFTYVGAAWSPVHFVVHASPDPLTLIPTLRRLLAEIDPDLPISDVKLMDNMVSDSVADRRFIMLLLAAFAAVALILALAGIYTMQAYSVTHRRSEIGVRMALGAQRQQVLHQVVIQGMRPVVLGIIVGLGGAVGLSRLLSNLLFGIPPSDPLTYAGVVLLLTTAALASCYMPSLRAIYVDPAVTWREE